MDQKLDRLKVLNQVIGLLALIMGVYHLVYTRWLLQDPLMHQNTHIAFALVLVYLNGIYKEPKYWLRNSVLILLSLIAVGYIFVNYSELAERAGLPTFFDVVIGTIVVIVVIEACRQAFGAIVPIIAVGLIIYALISSYLPPPFFHTSISYAKVKTDKVDSHTLAQLLRLNLIPPAHQISPELRDSRDLMRARLSLVHKKTSCLNSIHRLLEKFNLSIHGNRNLQDLSTLHLLSDLPYRESVLFLWMILLSEEQI